MNRFAAFVLSFGCLLFAGCTSDLAPEIFRRGIADFKLNHLVVIVDEPTKGPLSRRATDDELKAAVTDAMSKGLRRFDGKGSYSIGIKVAGYVLAQPGIPVLFAPRSMLLLNVNVYDAASSRINKDPYRLTVFEDAGGDTVVGSGYTQSAEEQLLELSENAAIEVEKWLRENEQWFVLPDAASPDAGPGVTADTENDADT